MPPLRSIGSSLSQPDAVTELRPGASSLPEASGHIRTMIASMSLLDQTALIETVGTFVFHFCHHPGNETPANQMIAYLCGSGRARLPGNLSVHPPTEAMILHLSREFGATENRPYNAAQSRQRLEKLYMDLVELITPAHDDFFGMIFTPNVLPNLYQPGRSQLPERLQPSIAQFKDKVLDEMRGETTVPSERVRRNYAFDINVFRAETLMNALQPQDGALEASNLPLLRNTLLDVFFSNPDKFKCADGLLDDHPFMTSTEHALTWLLGPDMPRAVQQQNLERLMACLRYRRQASSSNRLNEQIHDALIKLVFTPDLHHAKLENEVLSMLRSAILKGLTTSPASVMPTMTTFMTAFESTPGITLKEEIIQLQASLVTWTSTHGVPGAMLHRLLQDFVLPVCKEAFESLEHPAYQSDLFNFHKAIINVTVQPL